MKLSLINSIALSFIIFFLSFNVLGNKIESSYKIEVAGIKIGTLQWSVHKNKTSYKTLLVLRDRGLISNIFKFSGDYSSEGYIIDGEYTSTKYNQSWKTKKKRRGVEIIFMDNMVKSLSLNPKEKEKPNINYYNIKNLTDPLSSFLNIITNKKTQRKTIDGRRIYNMKIANEKKIDTDVFKKIIIIDYQNIWAKHNRNDLRSIEFEQALTDNYFFPKKIKIKHRGLSFILTLI